MASNWRKQSQRREHNNNTYSYHYATLQELIDVCHSEIPLRHSGLDPESTDARCIQEPDATQHSSMSGSLILALDHITDAGNFGAICRSAEVVGAAGIVVPNARQAQVNDGVYRTSAGAVEHIKIAQVSNLVSALNALKDNGFWVCGATEHASQDIWEAPLEGKLVVCMGSEDTGLSRLVRETCDFEFKLPQYGQTESLNVAQACTAILYEWRRRVEAAPKPL